jgi:AtzE family amidohydrolase
MATDPAAGALALALAVRTGEISAVEVATAALERIGAGDPRINAFTDVWSRRALAEAAAVDARRARGDALPPLAGVPYAVKNLYDVEGEVTRAGSVINASLPRAAADAAMVSRLRASGAVLVGSTNMDEYAYGFTTENGHFGATHNPHDVSRSAGGSSGGSAAAVAAGFVPLSLGSDTNGSIRVPASFCGIFGLKPTYGRLSRRGAFPFVASLDHVGPFARSAADLAACYDALQGPDALDPACAQRAVEPASPSLGAGIAGLRMAALGGYFEEHALPEALAARDAVAKALGVTRSLALPEAQRARAAAYVITAAEGGALHLANLKARAAEFDPLTRDRLLAGALVPAAWVLQAQRFRAWFRARVLEAFREVDVLLAPAAPFAAVPLGSTIGANTVALRPNVGVLTQPLSFIGLPVVAVPVWSAALPVGVQIIAAPWREAEALRVAAFLEREGVARAPIAA